MKNLITPSWKSFLGVVVTITLLWTVSSVGYYDITELLELDNGYNEAPLLLAAYYGVWAGIVLFIFRPSIMAWTEPAGLGESRLAAPLMLMAFAFFAMLVLPQLPQPDPPEDLNVADIVTANSWYFIPKTVEILFQQVLLSALVVGLRAQSLSMHRIMALSAVLFGGFHLSLALGDVTANYVTRYTVAATLFGLVFPWLILRVRNGFVYAFGLHWTFYAVDTTISHFIFAAPPPESVLS